MKRVRPSWRDGETPGFILRSVDMTAGLAVEEEHVITASVLNTSALAHANRI